MPVRVVSGPQVSTKAQRRVRREEFTVFTFNPFARQVVTRSRAPTHPPMLAAHQESTTPGGPVQSKIAVCYLKLAEER